MRSDRIWDWVPHLGKKECKKPRWEMTDNDRIEGEIEFMFDEYSKPKDI